MQYMRKYGAFEVTSNRLALRAGRLQDTQWQAGVLLADAVELGLVRAGVRAALDARVPRLPEQHRPEQGRDAPAHDVPPADAHPHPLRQREVAVQLATRTLCGSTRRTHGGSVWSPGTSSRSRPRSARWWTPPGSRRASSPGSSPSPITSDAGVSKRSIGGGMSSLVELGEEGDERSLHIVKQAGAYDSTDPDTSRIWWKDVGVHQRPTPCTRTPSPGRTAAPEGPVGDEGGAERQARRRRGGHEEVDGRLQGVAGHDPVRGRAQPRRHPAGYWLKRPSSPRRTPTRSRRRRRRRDSRQVADLLEGRSDDDDDRRGYSSSGVASSPTRVSFCRRT